MDLRANVDSNGNVVDLNSRPIISCAIRNNISGWWFDNLFSISYIWSLIWDHPSHWRTPSFFKMGTLHHQPEIVSVDSMANCPQGLCSFLLGDTTLMLHEASWSSSPLKKKGLRMLRPDEISLRMSCLDETCSAGYADDMHYLFVYLYALI